MGGGAKPRKTGGPEGWAPKGGAPKGGAPKGRAPKGGRPEGWEARRVGGPKFRAFSSLSRHSFAVSVSLWRSSRGILVVF